MATKPATKKDPAAARAAAKAAAQAAAEQAAQEKAASAGEPPGKATAPEVAEPTHMLVKTRPGVPRFCRGGEVFGPEERKLNLDDFTPEQVLAIAAEPMLHVAFLVEA